jgi:hypothetical protein
MIYFFSTCVDSIRTIPVLQHDPHRAEDLDTKAEDHAADDWRYACMSRPWIKKLPKDAEEKRATQLTAHRARPCAGGSLRSRNAEQRADDAADAAGVAGAAAAAV